jgi:stage IV sporulation protein FB
VLRAGMQPIWNPFGHLGSGAPLLTGGRVVPAFTLAWWVGWFGYLNWVLFLANLIPALPLDGGRALRALLAGQPKESMVAPWTAHSVAAVLGLVGLFRLFPTNSGGWELISLAILIELMVRLEARMLEDGGFFEDGVFGYDFSEGYTSLESSAPKVRPYRESALKRWRRRRSELRRQRRQAQDAAEEQRMDEILAKLYREGRAALTDEEHRFLIRVSAKYRARHRTQHE